ncbi:MAG: YceD family protein [Armatimonadota bacterium]
MKLDLTEIAQHVGKQMSYEVDEAPDTIEDLQVLSSIRGQLRFTNTGDLLLVRGFLHTSVELECSRCLRPFEMPLQCEVEEQVELRALSARPFEHPQVTIIPEEGDTLFLDGNILDLTELIRQMLLVSLPIKPLHDEECKGLCPTCGADLNEGECSCEKRVGHPAFAVLANLLAQMEEG